MYQRFPAQTAEIPQILQPSNFKKMKKTLAAGERQPTLLVLESRLPPTGPKAVPSKLAFLGGSFPAETPSIPSSFSARTPKKPCQGRSGTLTF